MTRDSSGLYKLWAIGSSALCVALLAYILASYAERSKSARLRSEALATEASTSNRQTGPAATDPSVAADPSAPALAQQAMQPAASPLPDELRDLASEWISADDGPGHSGHAILLDLERRRELIVENCRHGGYFDDARGEPMPPDWHCDRVVAGRIAAIDGGSLTVLPPGGGAERVSIAHSGSGSSESLELTIDGKRIALVPGSKNDLLQRLELAPEIQHSKDRAFDFEVDRIEEARRRAEQTRPSEQTRAGP